MKYTRNVVVFVKKIRPDFFYEVAPVDNHYEDLYTFLSSFKIRVFNMFNSPKQWWTQELNKICFFFF